MRVLRALKFGLLAAAVSYPAGILAADVFSLNAEVCEGSFSASASDGELACSGNTSYQAQPYSTSQVADLFDAIAPERFAELAQAAAAEQGESFDRIEGIVANLDYRGLPIDALFPVQGAIGEGSLFCIRFDGVENDTGNRIDSRCPAGSFAFGGLADSLDTRQSSIDAFEEYFKTNEDGTASRVNRRLAQSSPNDPVAGNPSSMQSRAADADFEQSFTHRVSQVWGCSTGASAAEKLMLAKAGFGCVTDVADVGFRRAAIEVAQASAVASDAASLSLYDDYFARQQSQMGENKLGLGIDYAQVSASPGGGGNELKTTVLSLPLSYSVVFDADPRKKLIIRFPVSMMKTEDATGYQAMLGLAYQHPINEAWSLSPSLGYSVVGSEDLGSAGALLSYSLSSSYTLNFSGWSLNIGNTIGQYSSQKIKIGDYESDSDVSNTVLTNGLLISGPNSLLSNDLVLEYFIYDTRFTGDKLFVDNSQEIGIHIGKLNTRNEVVTSFIKGTVSYARASGDNSNEADVLRLSLQFKF